VLGFRAPTPPRDTPACLIEAEPFDVLAILAERLVSGRSAHLRPVWETRMRVSRFYR